MIEQGTSFTIVRAPRDPQPRPLLVEAVRVWLGATNGTDWLVRELEQTLGDDLAAYEVETTRRAIHIGASGETATVVLTLLGLGAFDILRRFYGGFVERLGEASAEAFVGWVRQRSAEHREREGLESADGPPNLFERDEMSLAKAVRGELADLLGAPAADIELLTARREDGLALAATYRHKLTAAEYSIEVTQDALSVRLVSADTGRSSLRSRLARWRLAARRKLPGPPTG